jgi:hypothetical protein
VYLMEASSSFSLSLETNMSLPSKAAAKGTL